MVNDTTLQLYKFTTLHPSNLTSLVFLPGTQRTEIQEVIVIQHFKICGDNRYPPFEFLNDKGAFKGFNVDIIQAISEELNISIDFSPLPWAKAMEAVLNNEFDAVQGMAISPKREQLFDFTEEYLVVAQSIFVSSHRKDIKRFEDLKDLKVAIQKGDFAYDIINSKMGYSKISLHYILLQDQEEAIKSLISEEVDAFIGNQLTGIYVAESLGKGSEIRIVGEPIISKAYAIAVKKGNSRLVSLFNQGIAAIKNSHRYEEIYAKWFGKGSYDAGAQINIENQIIENVAAGVISINRIGTIVSINSYTRKYFDFDINPLRRHYLETPLRNIISSTILEDTILTGQTFFDLEVPLKHKKQETVISYNICPLYDFDSAILGAVITFRDISEEIKLKQSLRTKDKMQSLGRLLANVAHEIRNPLTAIKAFIELLPVHYDNAEYRQELMRHVPAEIDRLDNLIEELLSYAKPKKANRKWCNIKDTITSVLDLMRYEKTRRRIEINIGKNIFIWADEQQLKQIFFNIIINALEATVEEGSVQINVHEEDGIKIDIRDNGHGIPAADLNKIFDPFFTTKESGTGLGLFIVYQLVKENYGEINVNSTEGAGTRIQISFPKKENNNA